MKTFNIKIVSDGTPKGTQVINEETGERLRNVKTVTWSIMAGKPFSLCYLELGNVPVEIKTKTEVE